MSIRLTLFSLLFLNTVLGQIKQQEHKDFRTKKEIEQELVIQKMKTHFKNDYVFSKNGFYSVNVNTTINAKPFYTFKGISTLQTLSPIDCESTYFLDKEKFEEYKNSENAIFKGERAPAEQIPFYAVSVFAQLENINKNYSFLNRSDFVYTLQENIDKQYYHLTFRSLNDKLPIVGKMLLSKKNYLPKSLDYTIASEYTFNMSSDNFNYKKSTGYVVKVILEKIAMTFEETNGQFKVATYQSEYQFKNMQGDTSTTINGDEGYSKIQLERYNETPKICKTAFNLLTLE